MLPSLCLLVCSMDTLVDDHFPLFDHFRIQRFAELLEDLKDISVPRDDISRAMIIHTSSPSGEEAIDLRSKRQCSWSAVDAAKQACRSFKLDVRWQIWGRHANFWALKPAL